jgi:hypothetical protein
MKTFMKLAAISLVLSASATGALAQPGKGNSGLAQAMVDTLTSGNATIGRDLESKGKGTASAVSGDGKGGWGSEGSGIFGGQVSNRDGNRGK